MTARALGIHPERWLIATSLALGLAAGLAIRTAGMLYTFGCLVLPGLVAKNLCHEVRSMFLVAPVVAVAAAVSGFVIAHHADYPPGQMTVAILCLFLTLAWLYRSTVSVFSNSNHAYPVDATSATSVSLGWRHSRRYKFSYVGAYADPEHGVERSHRIEPGG